MNKTNQTRTPAQYFTIGLKGICMGAADVVPGVSGGTMAFILGIYEELLWSIRSFDLEFARRLFALKFREAFAGVGWKFLSALGVGILTAIFSLAKIISWLLINQPVLIWSFFFGLVLASVVTVSRRVGRWTPALGLAGIASALASFFLVGLTPAETPETYWFIFLSGAAAICAMILPGISGSFILVLLGKYHFILDAVNQRNLVVLAVTALGAGFGLLAFSRALTWLFKKHHDLAVAVLCGLMLGSLRKVWPWKIVSEGLEKNMLPAAWGGEAVAAAALAGLGAFLVLALERVASADRRKQASEIRNF